jgi:glutaconyl-CoA/methylmalonyl-CoA decarboxylase subunit gamma
MKEFDFLINGNEYKVKINEFEDNIANLTVNDVNYEVKVKLQESKTPIIKNLPVIQSVMERTSLTSKTMDRSNFLKAPIPGLILKIIPKIGDNVKIGETLLILEAMKMQNEIQASKDGKISKINVKEGQNVFEGDVLIEIE